MRKSTRVSFDLVESAPTARLPKCSIPAAFHIALITISCSEERGAHTNGQQRAPGGRTAVVGHHDTRQGRFSRRSRARQRLQGASGINRNSGDASARLSEMGDRRPQSTTREGRARVLAGASPR